MACDENVVEVLERRVQRLENVNSNYLGYKEIVKRHDIDNMCSNSDIFLLRQKSAYLCIAYKYALDHMNKWSWIKDCCQQAANYLGIIGCHVATNNWTIARWNNEFKQHQTFEHPNWYIRHNKTPTPILFELFPEAKHIIQKFCNENLADLTVMRTHEYVCDVVIDKLQHYCSEDVDEPTLGSHYLASLNHTSTPSVWRWLHFLGYRYQPTKKTYYVDGHERVEQQQSRINLAKQYIQEWELSTHRYIQFTEQDLLTFVRKNGYKQNELLACAVKYVSKEADKETDMYELHVDDHEGLHALANDRYPLGGCLSHKHNPNNKPLIILGQDECIYQQFTIHGKQWCGPNGERALMPKTDGYGVMISAFQCREFGFSMPLSGDEFERVNSERNQVDKNTYVDKDAALKVYGTTTKQNLTTSPFITYFQ